MKTLSIDIETYSDVQLPKTGVYRYCESDNFEILLFAYSVDSQPVQVVDLACGETIPEEIIAALEDDTVIKWAFNAAFERICLSRFLGYPTGTYLNPESWCCSMIWAATMGLPLSLEGVGAVLGLEKQKLTEGKDLIKYFCQPCAATKTNGGRIRKCDRMRVFSYDSIIIAKKKITGSLVGHTRPTGLFLCLQGGVSFAKTTKETLFLSRLSQPY